MKLKWCQSFLISVLSLLFLSGCWDKAELTEFSFAQAIGVDVTDKGKIQLTTLFLKPTGAGGPMQQEQGGKAGSQRSFSIQTEADTVMEAIRDSTINAGRRAKLDHMRVVLVSEKLLQKQNIGDIMDFFSRDQEPRGTIQVMVTKGKASDYMKVEPFIESTLGEQLRTMEEATANFAAKTISTNLLDMTIQLKSQTGIAMVPYAQFEEKQSDTITLAGIVILKQGTLSAILTPQQTQRMLMLLNEYKSGIIEPPCPNDEKKKESFDAVHVKTQIKPVIQGDTLTVRLSTAIEGTVGELKCTEIKKKKDEDEFKNRIKQQISREFDSLIALLQDKQLDAFGIGNKIYADNPALWKRWKDDWGERFARARFEHHIEVRNISTGMNVGNPYSKYKEE